MDTGGGRNGGAPASGAYGAQDMASEKMFVASGLPVAESGTWSAAFRHRDRPSSRHTCAWLADLTAAPPDGGLILERLIAAFSILPT